MKARFICLIALAVMTAAAPAYAQIDISGEWAARGTEDQPHRGPGAELGDYTGLPINAAARQKASVWDASILSLPERMAQPHPGVYFMRGPGPNMRVTKRVDPVTLQLIAYTLEGVFGRNDRVIWMDGRPHPSPNAEYTWEGFSTGRVEGSKLTITTTHLKWGVIQRNGVPASPKAVMTEHFIRHGDNLTLVTLVDDPVYLEEPFIRTSHWQQSSGINPDARWLFEVVEETDVPRGWVPHWPIGTKQDEFARRHGLPFEATQGGKETLYPEYAEKLKQMLANLPRPAATAAR
jgi:hypothetical protein